MFAKLIAVAGIASAAASTVTPVQKVITMLGEMEAKGKKEKHEEGVRFSAFSQWCDDTDAAKSKSIGQATIAIGEYEGAIAENEAEAEAQGAKIGEKTGEQNAAQKALDEAKAVRAGEKKDFLAQKGDYEESIDALGRAISTLKGKIGVENTRQATLLQAKTALLQVTMMSQAQKSKVLAALEGAQEPEGNASVSAKAYTYEFQSQGIVDMLEQLESKFVQELREFESDEANAAHAFNMVEQKSFDVIEQLKKDIAVATKTKAEAEAAAGQAKGDLEATQTSKAADEKYLADTKAECEMKSKEFEGRQKLRAGEIEAIQKAVEILGSKAVSGNADTYLPALAQKAVSLLQVRRNLRGIQSRMGDEERQQAVVTALQKAQAKLDSKPLALLAARVADSPFAKVTAMIEDLIAKLMEEANAEAGRNGFCTKEIAATIITREDKTETVDALTAKVEQMTAEIASLSESLAELTEAVTELETARAKATEIRNEESATNKQTVADSKVAQEAVAQALAVLKEFYAHASEATDLMQVRGAADDAPVSWDSDKAYTGMQGSSTGVVGMIEVIQSDFVRLETETATEEATAAKEYQTFMDDSEEDLAVKTAEIEHKTARKAKVQTEKNETQGELATASDELAAANDYWTKLKTPEQCLYFFTDEQKKKYVDGTADYAATKARMDAQYADRKLKREQEIESLKEALTILSEQ